MNKVKLSEHIATKSPTKKKKKTSSISNYENRGRMWKLIPKHPPKLKGNERVNASILNLSRIKPTFVPATHRHPSRLLKVQPQNLTRQILQPRVHQISPPLSVASQPSQFHHIPLDRYPIEVLQLFQIFFYAHPDERVALRREKPDEGPRDGLGVDELEYQAPAADAELDDGHGILDPAEAGPPLQVEPHDEAGELVAVDAFDVGDPFVDGVFLGGDDGPDLVVEESHVVPVVGVVRQLVVVYAYRHFVGLLCLL